MILHLAPHTPLLVRAGAATLLTLHIGGAAIGIVSGWVAILARKGGRLHARAGKVFFVAMLIMAAIGGAVAPFLPLARWSNTTAATSALYLVATSWATVRRRPYEVGRFERVAMVVALVLAALAVAGGAGLRLGGEGVDFSVYLFGGVCALAAACDLHVILRGGVAGPARVARHLWRMSLALTLVTASFFLGQQKFLPAPVRGTLWPALPVFAALGLLLFWMARVRLYRASSPPVIAVTARRKSSATSGLSGSRLDNSAPSPQAPTV